MLVWYTAISVHINASCHIIVYQKGDTFKAIDMQTDPSALTTFTYTFPSYNLQTTHTQQKRTLTEVDKCRQKNKGVGMHMCNESIKLTSKEPSLG